MKNADNRNGLTDSARTELEKLSFEEAMEKLETLVNDMERGSVPLEESINSYEEGTRLVRYCQELLDRYSKKIIETAGGEIIE